jgi:hypothetical protein
MCLADCVGSTGESSNGLSDYVKSVKFFNSYQDTRCAYKRSIEASSCNDFCSGKAISIAYTECVSVALVIQHAKRMRRIVICGLSRCAVLFYIIS